LKQKLYTLPTFPTNREELIQNVTQIWNSLTQELADNLLNGMPKRMEEVVRRKGKWSANKCLLK
jgi:hypothetical protein